MNNKIILTAEADLNDKEARKEIIKLSARLDELKKKYINDIYNLKERIKKLEGLK